MLFCALLHLNLALEEDPIVGLGRVGLGYGGRVGGWGLDRGVGRVWDDEEVEEDPIVGLGRVGIGYDGRVGGWGLGRGVGRVWDVENDEDAVIGLRGMGRMGHLGMGYRLGLGLHGLGMLGRRHGLGTMRRGLWDEDESEDVENDAILGLRHGLGGWGGRVGGWGGRVGGWGLRGLWDEEDELINEPSRMCTRCSTVCEKGKCRRVCRNERC